ncbi:nuclear transport factor 2 family protein [Haladaptatus sp. NG-SE-30]
MTASTRTTNLEVVQRWYEDLARGDIEGVLAAFDDDIEFIEAEGSPYGGTYHGPDEVFDNVLGPISEEWDEFVVEPERFVDGEDTIVAFVTYRGTYGETGREFESPVVHAFDFEDGEIARFQQYVDTVRFNEPLED